MREALLRRNITIISIVSVVLAGLILLVMKLRFFDTINTDIAKANTDYEANETAGKERGPNIKAQRIAERNLTFASQQTDVFRQRFRSLPFNLPPEPDAGPRIATWRRYLNEYNSDYGIELRRVLLQAADETDVVINSSVKVSAPPLNPEDVVSPPGGFLKPLASGTVGVQATGSLPNVLRFLERINQSEVLLTTGAAGSVGIKIEAAPAGVRATFNIAPYLVATGPSAQLPAAIVAAAPASGSASPSGSSPTTPGTTTP